MKCRMYGISLVVLVSVLAAWVLRTHVPMTTARKGPGNSAVNGDATAAQLRMTNRSHLAALGRASETQLLKTYGKLPLGFEANQGPDRFAGAIPCSWRRVYSLPYFDGSGALASGQTS